MKAGDIVFVRGHSPLSKIIRFFDKGKFSHCAIAVSETHVLEVNWNMVTSIREMKYTDYEIVDLCLEDYEREEIVKESVSLVGKWYDYPLILWLMLKKLFALKSINRFNNPKNLICSEAIFYLLFKIGFVKTNADINADITPNQLYRVANLLKRC